MNVIYYRNIVAENGWKWRVELFTGSSQLLNNPQYIELLPMHIVGDIVWKTGYNRLPIGLTDTPSLELTFAVDELEGTTEYEHLRERLFRPFVEHTFPPITKPAKTYTLWDDELSEFYEYTEPASSVPPKVRTCLLTTIVRLTTNFGNAALDFGDITCTPANAANGTIVFSGAQPIAPAPEYDSTQGTLKIEFTHLTRFVLEQINSQLLVDYMDSQPALAGYRRAEYVVHTSFTSSGTPSGRPLRIVARVEGTDERASPANIELMPLSAFFSLLSALANMVRSRCLRNENESLSLSTGYISIGARFYRQHLSSGDRVTPAVPLNNLYIITRINAYYEEKIIGGMFAAGSQFMGAKNLYDWLFDQLECGMQAVYAETQIICDQLSAGISIDHPYSAYTPAMITEQDIGDYKLAFSADALASAEVRCDGSNVIMARQGLSLAGGNYNCSPYFHNLPPAQFAFSSAIEDESVNPQIAWVHEFSEGRLYYWDASIDFPVAVHQAMGFRDNGVEQSDEWVAADFWPYRIFNLGYDEMQVYVEQYYARWRNTLGVPRRVATAIMRHFGYAELVQIRAKTYVQARTGFSGRDQLLPRNVGRMYTISGAIARPYMNMPTQCYLTKSTMNVVQSTCEVEMLCVPEPENIFLY